MGGFNRLICICRGLFRVFFLIKEKCCTWTLHGPDDVRYIILINIYIMILCKNLLTVRERLFSPPCFVSSVLLIFVSFLRCVVLCFVCLRLVSCVTNVATVSGFYIFLDCHFGFLCRLFSIHITRIYALETTSVV